MIRLQAGLLHRRPPTEALTSLRVACTDINNHRGPVQRAIYGAHCHSLSDGVDVKYETGIFHEYRVIVSRQSPHNHEQTSSYNTDYRVLVTHASLWFEA